jgi:hypothetical protein
MWLEQTVWIWAPVASAVLVWMTSRLMTLGRQMRRLEIRVSQLEQARPSKRVKFDKRARSAA